jgi:NADH-quinone oxidoreductase subunit E
MEGDYKLMTEKLNTIIDKYRGNKTALISLLQDLTREMGYLSEELLQQVSREMDVPLSKLYSLATFYNSFRLEPLGRHHICVCVGTACHVKGATQIVETLERELKIKAGERTPDDEFSIETVACLGTCALGPLVVVDDEYHGNMDQNKVKKLLKKTKEES